MRTSRMHIRKGIRISLLGTGIEAVGMLLDILHHVDIGIHAEEGLLTLNHFIIFAGFAINFVGVLLTMMSARKQ
ncbi:MAG: hypothetical protein A3I33_01235 [Candidatus Colwellbacteria bacterium RIFCSPLOWO2_02_FULL_45_11]|uniref:Uncharacterized protein n=1 Tax=Candidatus Colwellbacteria bacterium RIFCSPLOWO2_02_FULL_45_11 TaxID=1797692 RepID=A0A1G1Z8Z5_9BACT|nr:MAG: hypothetical protein A3I33_01235 [Candidatus Colwellbacteria bacterium RIFCSPLOWO2_02_FULL_45_11]